MSVRISERRFGCKKVYLEVRPRVEYELTPSRPGPFVQATPLWLWMANTNNYLTARANYGKKGSYLV